MTMNRMRQSSLFLAIASAIMGGCSSDAIDPSEPRVDTPGAFVAVTEEEGLVLLRTLGVLANKQGNNLFVTVYSGHPADWDDAREMSKQRDIPIKSDWYLFAQASLPKPLKVVWFRTLTKEERARIP